MVSEIWCMTGCNCSFPFWAIFCPFTALPPNNPKNQNSEKMKKTLEISSFYISVASYQKLWSDDVQFVRYGVWQPGHDRCNCYFSFFLFFFLLLPLPTAKRKIKILKKWKNYLEISLFYICLATKNYDQMMSGFWDMYGIRSAQELR